jgi:hypothetical protein
MPRQASGSPGGGEERTVLVMPRSEVESRIRAQIGKEEELLKTAISNEEELGEVAACASADLGQKGNRMERTISEPLDDAAHETAVFLPLAECAMLVDRETGVRHYIFTASADIGRSEANDVVLEDYTVSRFHARIRREGASFRIYGLPRNVNGVVVNWKRVTDSMAIKHGDLICIGRVELIFEQLAGA